MFPNAATAAPVPGQPVCALAVDAEEDFDWDRPVASTTHSTNCMRHIADLQEMVSAYGLRPTYLLTYPVLQDEGAVHLLRRQHGSGRCDLGIQLHPWVTPPFESGDAADDERGASFSGNLPAGVEERKLVALKDRFIACFGAPPAVYRAGRYGFGRETAAILERQGFTIDTSLAPRTDSTDEGGPDFSSLDYGLFWFGQERRLLEVPLCRSVVGWGGRLAPRVYRRLSTPALRRLRVLGILTRLGFAERITLSPEGNDLGAMLRLVRYLRAGGQTVFVLSFHSSSLTVGRNPYVRTQAELHAFYDRLSGVLDALARRGFRFASLADLPALLPHAPV
jgi:hypothetical protein